MARHSIRATVAADLGTIVAIERATFPDPWSRQAFTELLGGDHVHSVTAVDASGAVVGYAMGSAIVDEGEILNLSVTASGRGQGTGRALLTELMARLRAAGAARIYLEVRRSNEAAIALYRAVGFQSLGVRKSYYAQPREDALTMTLEFGSQTAKE